MKDLKNYVLKEKSQIRRSDSKEYPYYFLKNLPEERQQKYKDNPKKLITHLDLLYCIYVSREYNDENLSTHPSPSFFGLTDTQFYRMLKQLESLGAIICCDTYYRFKKGISKRSKIDYSKTRGIRRKYIILEDTIYFKKIQESATKQRIIVATNDTNRDGYKFIEGKIKLDKIETFVPSKEEQVPLPEKVIDQLKTNITNDNYYKKSFVVSSDFDNKANGEDYVLFNQQQLKEAAKIIQTASYDNIPQAFKDDAFYLNENSIEAFKRKSIVPNIKVKLDKEGNITFRTSARVFTNFTLLKKEDRKDFARMHGMYNSVDVHAEIFQVLRMLSNPSKRLMRYKDVYLKIAKDLDLVHNQDLINFAIENNANINNRIWLKTTIKESVVRILQIKDYDLAFKSIMHAQVENQPTNYTRKILPNKAVYKLIYNHVMKQVSKYLPEDIFFWTSWIETKTIADLRRNGIFVENVYDEFFYSKKNEKLSTNFLAVNSKLIFDTLEKNIRLLSPIFREKYASLKPFRKVA